MAARGFIDPSSTQLRLEHDVNAYETKITDPARGVADQETSDLDRDYRKLFYRRMHNLDGILVTPKELNSYYPSAEEFANKSFGYKGYPGGQFLSPRQPLRDQTYTTQQEQEINYKKAQHFSPEKSRIYENNIGVQYSDGVPLSSQDPRRIRDPLKDKTSAELRKYKQMATEAELDIQTYKQEKLRRLKETEMEKKADMAMLESYNPWGQPGHGAPQKDPELNKRKKFTEEELSPRTHPAQSSGGDDFHSQFGRPGHGAPMMTSSGKLISNIRGDAAIRFGQKATIKHRPAIDPIRYHTDSNTAQEMKNVYDKQIKDNALMNEEARIKERKQELEMLNYNPYGKPGAGAPNQGKGNHYKSASLSEDVNELRRMEMRQDKRRRTQSDELGLEHVGSTRREMRDIFDPWGKGFGAPMRDEYGNVERHPATKDKEYGIMDYGDSAAKGGPMDIGVKNMAGAPRKTDSGKINARYASTMNYDVLGGFYFDPRPDFITKYAKITELPPHRRSDVYDPWGKSGAGAPKKDQNGNVQTTVFGALKHERLSGDAKQRKMAAQEYLNELQHEMAEQKQIRDESERYQKKPIGEFASVIRDGQVGRPRRDQSTGMLLNQHLPSSDVTKEQTDTRPQKNENTKDYHNVLVKEAQRRHVDRQLDKLHDMQLTEQHYKAYDGFWGKPGAGAPLHDHKKLNLNQNLHHNPKSEPSYQKVGEHGTVETSPRHNNYVKTTIHSNNANHFENVIDNQHRLPRRDHAVFAPYATI